MFLEVIKPGPLTTVQDGGRTGWAHMGVPAAGPCDWLSHALANRLVGNPDDAAGLEFTLLGPTLRATGDLVCAVTGATATVDGEPVPADASFRVPAGVTLAVGRATPGVRGYVAVGGGVEVPAVLGSRAADTFAGLGPGRLAAGDRLPVAGVDEPYRPKTVDRDALARGDEPLRVVLGPRDDWFTPDSIDLLLGQEYTVTPASDRTGIRLAGAPLSRAVPGAELPAEGMITGALQVPVDGQPILLLANHGTTGGYPVAAVVATADLPAAGQVRPGGRVSFRAVDRSVAVKALSDLRERLDAAVRTG